MSSWLSTLPHQIPFRAASRVTRMDEVSVDGIYLCSSADALTEGGPVPVWMVIEAMAQIAGGLAFRDRPGHGYLSAIDDASIDGPLESGESLELKVEMEANFGGIFRFRGRAFRAGSECARAKFYLATPP
ncbi:MAG TPA: hypothetical protein VNM92_02020 [Thermoanaerobaculia bacterium]|nr:hypothetical protein [Thermoanaerobaculia bacterium]